ncbi:MAG TPA: hypothetical protein DD979_06600 [Gammaproteobacteria bacterium]|jgi:peptidyl-prolyl cis-trans isomerase B (cyclophilin B)|nr:hypothetical protein [Gammaproteobacteria bacterium]
MLFVLGFLPFAVVHAQSDRVVIGTNVGDIVIELFEDRAPESVNNFRQYVKDGFYTGTIFHRVIDGFMIQGGGYTADFRKKSTRTAIPNEANNGIKNQKYTVAMARTSDPHSATSQFFINTTDNDFLNHTGMNMRGWGYAVFARVVEGHDIVDQIGQTRTSSGGPFARDVPVDTITINRAELVEPASEKPPVAEARAGQ